MEIKAGAIPTILGHSTGQIERRLMYEGAHWNPIDIVFSRIYIEGLWVHLVYTADRKSVV